MEWAQSQDISRPIRVSFGIQLRYRPILLCADFNFCCTCDHNPPTFHIEGVIIVAYSMTYFLGLIFLPLCLEWNNGSYSNNNCRKHVSVLGNVHWTVPSCTCGSCRSPLSAQSLNSTRPTPTRTPTPTLAMRLSCNFVNVYTIASRVQYTFTRVHARIPNGHPRDDPRAKVRVGVGVRVRVGPMEFQLNATASCNSTPDTPEWTSMIWNYLDYRKRMLKITAACR